MVKQGYYKKFERVGQQNCYTIVNNNCIVVKSYNTIVGIICPGDSVSYEIKYSRTTSKQFTQLVNRHDIKERVFLNDPKLLCYTIYKYTEQTLNCHYDECPQKEIYIYES